MNWPNSTAKLMRVLRRAFRTRTTCGDTIFVLPARLTPLSNSSRLPINWKRAGTQGMAWMRRSTGIGHTTLIFCRGLFSTKGGWPSEQHIREAMQLKPTTMYAGYNQKMLADFLID